MQISLFKLERISGVRGLILAWLLFGTTSAFAQNKSLSGVIQDKEKGTPIPWAHILFEEKGIATVSNDEGRFSINVSSNIVKITLKISCIGYKTNSITVDLNEPSGLQILLEQDVKLLSEVIVKPINVRQLILEAIRKIPINYPSIPTKTTGFYRESLRYDSVNYIYISEGVIEARKGSYQEELNNGQVKLIKSRKKEFPDSLHTLDKIKFYAGPHIVHRFDFVINRLEFINERKLNNYDYVIDRVTFLNGKEVYEISFKPIASDGLFQGTFFLDVNSGAFICAKYKLTNSGLKQYERTLNLFTSYLNREYLVNYMQVGNKWMVQNIWQQGLLVGNRLKDTVVYATEFVATKIDTLNTAAFSYNERIQYGDFFVDKTNNLDSAFWNGFTILKENSFIQRLQNGELNTKSIATDYSEKESMPTIKSSKSSLLRFIEKTTFEIAITSLFPNYSISDISLVGMGININSPVNQSDFFAFGLYSSLNVDLSKRLITELGFISSFGKLGFENAILSIGYKCQTSIKTRPLKLIGGLGFSYNSVYLPIGTVTGPFSIDGKDLSNKIDVNIQREFFAIQPSLKIGLELNRRWDFFISINYLIDLGIDHKILFREQDGFFSRKSASLKATDSSIDFRIGVNKAEVIPSLTSPLFFNTGFTFKYRR